MAQVIAGDYRSEGRWCGLIRAPSGRVRSAVFAWIAVLAVVLQLGAAPAPRAVVNSGEADAVAALGALSALLGPHVALCLHEDGSAPGSPAPGSHSCCDDCALCQHNGPAAALLPPSHAIQAPLGGYAKPLSIASDLGVAKPKRPAFAQPRAPPISA